MMTGRIRDAAAYRVVDVCPNIAQSRMLPMKTAIGTAVGVLAFFCWASTTPGEQEPFSTTQVEPTFVADPASAASGSLDAKRPGLPAGAIASGNANVDLVAFSALRSCFDSSGPGVSTSIGCGLFDYDFDGDVDLSDFSAFMAGAPLVGVGHTACGTGSDCFAVGEDTGCSDPVCCNQVCDADVFCCESTWDVLCIQTAFGICNAAPPVPANDSCAIAYLVTDGTTDFANLGATTDGPPISGCGLIVGVESDIWFCYTATCTGVAIMSLCGSAYDTTVAVYPGCACPTTDPLVCGDDDCGFALDSRVTHPVLAGDTLTIRVGGYPGNNEQGPGQLTIICGPDADNSQACGPGNGACGAANGTPGCDDASCCAEVCAIDAFCCDVEWDANCSIESTGVCDGNFITCGDGAGSCNADNDTPGCDDVDCCNAVCGLDPYCCLVDWDDVCAAAAAGCP
jgi:hypothetical protein